MTRQLTVNSVDAVIPPAAFNDFASELGVEPRAACNRLSDEVLHLIGLLRAVKVVTDVVADQELRGANPDNEEFDHAALATALCDLRPILGDGLVRARDLHCAIQALVMGADKAAADPA